MQEAARFGGGEEIGGWLRHENENPEFGVI
jgi:hypothetical protein